MQASMHPTQHKIPARQPSIAVYEKAETHAWQEQYFPFARDRSYLFLPRLEAGHQGQAAACSIGQGLLIERSQTAAV